MSKGRRVAITGCGVVSPIGNSIDELRHAIENNISGIAFRSDGIYEEIGAGLEARANIDYDSKVQFKKETTMDRCTLHASEAARQAVEAASLDTMAPDVIQGLYWGTGMGGASSIDDAYRRLYARGKDLDEVRLSPLTIVRYMSNSAASHLARQYGMTGIVKNYSVACASSSIAIGDAFLDIRNGTIERAIAGGSEALLAPGVIKAWRAMNTLAEVDQQEPELSCKPFDVHRSGFVIGEGAGAIVLESFESATARGAPIFAEVIGFGRSNDADHLVHPNRDGQVRALADVLRDAGLDAVDVDYINAHGTATEVGDIVEAEAIREIFGDTGPLVSSTKSAHGHMMGAGGAVELIITQFALTHGLVPTTVGLRELDSRCQINLVQGDSRKDRDIEFALSSSFAFGGTNAVIALKRFR